MIKISTVAVLGGGGRTGKHIVKELLNQGYSIKLLLRKPESFQLDSPHIGVLTGDARDWETIHSLVEGCQGVVNTLSQRKDEPLVASQATRHVLKAMLEFGIRRYVLVAGLNVDTPFDKKGADTLVASDWMKVNFPVIQEDRQKTYSILSASDADWTLVRVPFIEFIETPDKINVSLEDCLGNKVRAASVARFVVQQLSDHTFIRKAPFIANA